MSVTANNGIPSAAGYKQFVHNLTTPKFSDRIIRQVYCRSVAMEVTTGDFSEGLIGCGATLGFRVEPAIEIHEYQKNQTLVPQELETEWRWISVDRAKYFNVKIDDIDKHQICDFDELSSNFCSQASKRMYTQLDPEVLMKMAIQADKRNKGNAAGMDGDLELGQYGAPLEVNKDNLIEVLSCAKIALEQSCRWEDGNMVMILPTVAEKAFYASDLAHYCHTGETSPVLNGTLRGNYMGWRIVFSNHVPRVFDATQNRWTYYVVFAHEAATGLVQQIDKCDIVTIERSFGEYYRGLWVYGHNTLIPEAVGVIYAYFN